jgi:hypothetical protein
MLKVNPDNVKKSKTSLRCKKNTAVHQSSSANIKLPSRLSSPDSLLISRLSTSENHLHIMYTVNLSYDELK